VAAAVSTCCTVLCIVVTRFEIRKPKIEYFALNIVICFYSGTNSNSKFKDVFIGPVATAYPPGHWSRHFERHCCYPRGAGYGRTRSISHDDDGLNKREKWPRTNIVSRRASTSAPGRPVASQMIGHTGLPALVTVELIPFPAGVELEDPPCMRGSIGAPCSVFCAGVDAAAVKISR
jgi:hypothetical protein